MSHGAELSSATDAVLTVDDIGAASRPASPRNAAASRASLPLRATIAALGAMVVAYLVALALHKDLDHDEHQFVASAALMAREGLLPYRDYPYHHLPYLSVFYALLFRVSDHLLLTARLASVAFALACVALVFALIRRAFADRPAKERDALATAFTVVFAVNPLFLYATARAWNHDAAVMLTLVAFLFVVRAADKPSALGSLFWSGVALGAATGVRSSFALLAPGFALGITMLRPPLRDLRAWALAIAAFTGGAAVALLPLVPLIAAAPGGFLHGNFTYNLALNPAYRRALGYGTAMSLTGKIEYYTADVLALRRSSFLLLAYVASWLCLAGRGARTHAFPQRLVFVLLPFVVLAALSATPSWYQYFYPLVPFLVLGIAYAAADLPAMRMRLLARATIAILLIGSVAALRHYAEVLEPSVTRSWTPTAVHDIGTRVAHLTRGGRVLTLAPIIPLEGGAEIYPELATGPFAWRTTPLVPERDRESLHLVGPADLSRLVSREPPAGVLVGAETEENERLEEPLVRYATEHGYRAEPVGASFVLWLAPQLPEARR